MSAAARQRLRSRMGESGLAAVLLVNPLSLRYLTGFHSNAYSRPLALVVAAAGEPTLVVPRLEELQARLLTDVRDVRSYVEWEEGSRAGGDLHREWEGLLPRSPPSGASGGPGSAWRRRPSGRGGKPPCGPRFLPPPGST